MRKSLVFILGLIFILLLTSCTISVKISTLPVDIDIANPVVAGSPHFATAIVKDDYDDYSFKWSASDGYIDEDTNTNSQIIWEAPNYVGDVEVYLDVVKDGKKMTVKEKIQVVESPMNTDYIGEYIDQSGDLNISISVRNDTPNNVESFSFKIAVWDYFDNLILFQGQEWYSDNENTFLLPDDSIELSRNLGISTPVKSYSIYVYQIDYEDGSYWEAN